jgi:hypothetical protein
MDDPSLVPAQAAKCDNSAASVGGRRRCGSNRVVSSYIIIYSSIFHHMPQPASGVDLSSTLDYSSQIGDR